MAKGKVTGSQSVKLKSIAASCFYSLCTRVYAEGGYWNSRAQQPCCCSMAVPLHSLLQIVRRSGHYSFLKISLFSLSLV